MFADTARVTNVRIIIIRNVSAVGLVYPFDLLPATLRAAQSAGI